MEQADLVDKSDSPELTANVVFWVKRGWRGLRWFKVGSFTSEWKASHWRLGDPKTTTFYLDQAPAACDACQSSLMCVICLLQLFNWQRMQWLRDHVLWMPTQTSLMDVKVKDRRLWFTPTDSIQRTFVSFCPRCDVDTARAEGCVFFMTFLALILYEIQLQQRRVQTCNEIPSSDSP